MKVTTVSASVRFSKDVGNKQFKTVELSAEGGVDANENWQSAQARLYADLGRQLKVLWSTNGNGHRVDGHSDSASEHYCQEHGVDYKKYEKGNQVWYSHKSGDGWCRGVTIIGTKTYAKGSHLSD